MTQRIYRPSSDGGELQLKVGSKWQPIFGVQNISVSGGDRETSEFSTLDGGTESTFGPAGVKDISITLNPSYFGAFYRKLIEESYYGNSTATVRYRTLAEKSDIVKGANGHGITLKKIEAGVGNEGVLSFEGSDGASITASDAIKETSELGIVTSGSDTAVSSERTEAEPAAGKFLIARYDGTQFLASEWAGNEVAAVGPVDGWNLIRYGWAFEWTCRVTTGMNPDLAANAAAADTIGLRQVSSGFKTYPITKAAA